jgi:hypothetical protein
MEALFIGPLKDPNYAPCLGARLTVANPSGNVTNRLIEILDVLPVIREIRPAEIV